MHIVRYSIYILLDPIVSCPAVFPTARFDLLEMLTKEVATKIPMSTECYTLFDSNDDGREREAMYI